MVLGVMSDTHGNGLLMPLTAQAMQVDYGVETIFHLGDDYRDGRELAAAGYTVRQVPGLQCPEYHDGRIPKRLFETFDGLTVACVHAEKDLRPADRTAAIVLTGHTHHAAIELIGRSLHVNPGHLKDLKSRGEPASYAIVDIGPTEVRARIVAFTGQIKIEHAVDRACLG